MNIYNSASTGKTLRFMFLVAIIGVALVLTYTIAAYYAFGAKWCSRTVVLSGLKSKPR